MMLNILLTLFLATFCHISNAKYEVENKDSTAKHQLGRHVLMSKDLRRIGPAKFGTNGSAIYKDYLNRNWFVKKLSSSNLAMNDYSRNSLIESVLASDLIRHILPDSAPLIMPYIDDKGEVSSASLSLGDFVAGTENEQENRQLLDLALDLLDVDDRQPNNVGGIRSGQGIVSAAVVDLDMAFAFRSRWIDQHWRWRHFVTSPDQENAARTLAKIAQISNDTIRRILRNSAYNLKPFSFDLLEATSNNSEAIIDLDFMIDNVIQRKAQIAYILENLDLLRLVIGPHQRLKLETALRNKGPNSIDDKFDLFASLAVDSNDVSLLSLLLEHGVKDPNGVALAKAIYIGANLLVETLFRHEAQDPYGKALAAAIDMNERELVEILLARGSKDPEGLALRTAIYQENDALIEMLIAHGSRDPEGSALRAAINIKWYALAETLIQQGSGDPDGINLNKLLENGKYALAEIMVKNGAKDPSGSALAIAIEKGKDKLFEILLQNGCGDSQGEALRAAIRQDKDQIAEILIRHGSKDPHGRTLALAIEKNNDLLVDTLLKHGARDPHGRAQYLAQHKGKSAMAEKIRAANQ